MFDHSSKWNRLVLVVILLGLLSGLSYAAGADPANVAAEEKISIIPEPVTVLVLLAGLMLFGWRRTRRRVPRAMATGTQD